MWAAVGLAVAPSIADAQAFASAQARQCFTAASNAALSFEVFQQAPPPLREDQPGYPFFPATAYTTQIVQRLWQSRLPGARKYYFQWGNRSTQGVTAPNGRLLPRKLNIQPGPRGARAERTAFSSTDRADACTLAQTAAALGRPAQEVERYAREGGIRTARLGPMQPQGLHNVPDTCVLPELALPPDVAGAVLDYEVADGRTFDRSFSFLTRWARLVRGAGKRAVLFTNAFDAPSQRYTGLSDGRVSRLVPEFDLTDVFLWSKNAQGDISRSFDRQLAMLNEGGRTDPKRLIVVFELAGATMEDARRVRDRILRDHLAGVMLWRNLAEEGGPCDRPVNLKIGCLLYGRCGSG